MRTIVSPCQPHQQPVPHPSNTVPKSSDSFSTDWNEHLIRQHDTINLEIDPPPDLGIEVEITHSTHRRMKIYAALQVPEVWRFDGQALSVWSLQPDGQYAPSETSRYFGKIRIPDLAGFVQRRTTIDENSLRREFRTWVRLQIGA